MRQLRAVATIVLLAVLLGGPRVPQPARAAADLVIYGDTRAIGWDDWSWDSNVAWGSAAPIHSGTAAVMVTYTANYAGFSVRSASAINPAGYTAIAFWAYDEVGGTTLELSTQATDSGPTSAAYSFSAPAGVWTEFKVPLSALGSPAAIARINIQNVSGVAPRTISLDDVRLVGSDSPPPGGPNISINAAGQPIAFDPARMLGTNTAVWLHSEGLVSATLRARTRALGNGLLRIPGGAYSQEYGALSCEMGANIPGAHPCQDATDARLSDFIAFLQATSREAIYTVNINTTAKEAAAVVAFFNAQVTNTTVIGTDSNGTDWKTAGYWATQRAQHGHPDPVGIRLWDFGNETYGGVKGSGPKCPDFGWEAVWTCDGTEYINGARGHEGYRQFRSAMRAVDPAIELGVVGYDDPAGYGNWTNDVLAAGGTTIDFLTVHPYPYFTFPPNSAAGYAQILALPQTQWSGIKTALRSAIQTHAGGRPIPLFATEYNLGNPDGDNDHLMARAIDGLYIADSIGQMIAQGFAAGLQWDLVGFNQANGANMGLMNGDASLARQPSYYVFPLWKRFGNQMLPITSGFDAAARLSVYAGRVDGHTISLLAINKTGQPIDATIAINGAAGGLPVTGGTVDVVRASALDAQSVTFNGVNNPADDLSNAPAQSLVSIGAAPSYQFAPYSITLLRLTTSGSGLHDAFLPMLHR
jgi:hypothetical protein